VIAKIPALESNLGLRPGSLRVFADDRRADRFIMRVIENDPHAEPAPWPGRWITSVTKPMEIGLSENGREVRNAMGIRVFGLAFRASRIGFLRD